jgi:protein involved in polysaccharide export with SLBB domain
LTEDLGITEKTMKLLRRLSGRSFVYLSGVFLASVLFCGCQTNKPDFSGMPPAQPRAGEDAVRFRVGNLVTVSFSGQYGSDTIPLHEERVQEDGTITLPLIGAVRAAGKTPGDLQKEIHDLYVPKFYVRLTVTVKSQELIYYVGGEVKSPGRQQYLGETTVTKAIQSAGDFTDFAKKTRVMLTRADGKTITVNCVKALKDPKLDLPVFPNDKITVPRTVW